MVFVPGLLAGQVLRRGQEKAGLQERPDLVGKVGRRGCGSTPHGRPRLR